MIFISQQEGEIGSNAARETELCSSHHKFEFQCIQECHRKIRQDESGEDREW
jgi:hypothetical protein